MIFLQRCNVYLDSSYVLTGLLLGLADFEINDAL